MIRVPDDIKERREFELICPKEESKTLFCSPVYEDQRNCKVITFAFKGVKYYATLWKPVNPPTKAEIEVTQHTLRLQKIISTDSGSGASKGARGGGTKGGGGASKSAKALEAAGGGGGGGGGGGEGGGAGPSSGGSGGGGGGGGGSEGSVSLSDSSGPWQLNNLDSLAVANMPKQVLYPTISYHLLSYPTMLVRPNYTPTRTPTSILTTLSPLPSLPSSPRRQSRVASVVSVFSVHSMSGSSHFVRILVMV